MIIKLLSLLEKNIIKKQFPNYIGFSILEKSQCYNYQVFYDVLLPIFQANSCQLLYCDTDSFILKYFLKLDEVTEKDFTIKKLEKLATLKSMDMLDTSKFH